MVRSWITDAPPHLLSKIIHVISFHSPQSSRTLSGSGEDEDFVSHIEHFHTHQRASVSAPTLQQWRFLTSRLQQKNTSYFQGESCLFGSFAQSSSPQAECSVQMKKRPRSGGSLASPRRPGESFWSDLSSG